VVVLLLASLTPARADEAFDASEKAVATILEFGGSVSRDLHAPGRPAIGVCFYAGDGEGCSIFPANVKDDDLRVLHHLPTLETVYFVGNHKVTDAGLVHLKGLTHLRDLSLNSTGITDAGLVHLDGLRTLKRLSLCQTAVTDAGLRHLRNLSQLERLDLVGLVVTDRGMGVLPAFPKLTRLAVGTLDVGGPGKPRPVYSGPDDPRISDAGLAHLTTLKQLEELSIHDTRITDAGLEHVRGLVKLRTLKLSRARITGAGLARLSSLRQLQKLDVSHNAIK